MMLIIMLLLQCHIRYSFILFHQKQSICLQRLISNKLFSTSIIDVCSDTIIERHLVFGREIYIKRDDLCHLSNIQTITGNKVRKLKGIHDLAIFPSLVISHGGTQSNAMRAIALLCKSKQAKFVYFSRRLPQVLSDYPSGNFKDAIDAGMEVHDLF